MAVQKFPPPPQLPKEFGAFGQQLNRWLIEVQNLLNAGGTIDPENVVGLVAAYLQITTNTANILTLQGQVATLIAEVATNTANIATNTANIATNTANIATNTANIATLTARNQIRNGAGIPGAGLGDSGDLYIDNVGIAPNILYAKIGGAWVALC